MGVVTGAFRVLCSVNEQYYSRFTPQSSPKKTDEREQCVLLGDLLALNNKFKEAARMYVKGEQPHRAVAMYSDLRMFDLAQVRGL